jgi:hypothetical protein
MNPSTGTISPLRQRMLDDMRMRKLEPKTQDAYVRAVRKLAGLHIPLVRPFASLLAVAWLANEIRNRCS